MEQVLKNKVALITGGARGIGRAIAKKLAAHGADIGIVYYNSSDEAEKLVAELTDMGRKAVALQANVADEVSVKEMALRFKEHFAKVDIIVSNAASGVLKPAMSMSTKHWRWCLETNALALHHLVKNFHDMLAKGGRVLALSSLGASRAIPNYSFIGVSKAALEALVRSLSLELAEKNVSVNTISAGVVDTDALKHFPNREQLLDEHQMKSLAPRPLLPQDVADVAYLLCLPESGMIRGQTIVVDAGYSIIA